MVNPPADKDGRHHTGWRVTIIFVFPEKRMQFMLLNRNDQQAAGTQAMFMPNQMFLWEI